MRTPPAFSRGDWWCALAATVVAFAVYAWTTAPSVTLLDAGEFIVAAQHFGVPHPTGYPLWTMLAWAFSRVPLGNVAWQLALLSGIFGALSVGVTALLIRSSARWIAPTRPAAATLAALALSLAYAFSQSAWSQAVIVEVYTLHALLVSLFLVSLYRWIRRPQKLGAFYAAVFFLSLGFSNHQLVLALAPLPLLAILLVRRDLFWDLLLAAVLTALIAYLAFALLANDPVVVKAAVRLAYLTVTTLGIALLIKRARIEWRLMVFLPLVVMAGLLPYAYLPFASATNPPMNWGYTRTPEGLFASFNRSQYSGTLSDLTLRLLSRALGVATPETETSTGATPEAEASVAQRGWNWSTFFAARMAADFSPLGPACFLLALLLALRAPPPARAWIVLLVTGFLLAMLAQPVLERARTDRAGWWLQMPYHTYTNLLFAVVAGFGAFLLADTLLRRWPRAGWLSLGLLLLPLWPLRENAAVCSQRDRWFGWEFGHDLLADLPRGAVVFGGTDPGRFVPTYLIFGESVLPPHLRIDPTFQRDDLYILTPNGLADRFYLAGLRDQYSSARPPAAGWLDRWLGRERAYPPTPLILPTFPEWQDIRQQAATELENRRPPAGPMEASQAAHAAVARWIFERNREQHAFFLEESFPMPWAYDHAEPAGLVLKLHPEPVAALSAETVERDFAFWRARIDELQANPRFAADFDAQRLFARLRVTGGNLYRHRGMKREAESAYRQALEIWSGSIEALTALANLTQDEDRDDEIIALFARALAADPNNDLLAGHVATLTARKAAKAELTRTRADWRQSGRLKPLRRSLELLAQLGREAEMDALLRESVGRMGTNPEFVALVTGISETRGDWVSARDGAAMLVAAKPDSADALFRLGRAQMATGATAAGVETLRRALDLGGLAARERFLRDPVIRALPPSAELNELTTRAQAAP